MGNFEYYSRIAFEGSHIGVGQECLALCLHPNLSQGTVESINSAGQSSSSTTDSVLMSLWGAALGAQSCWRRKGIQTVPQRWEHGIVQNVLV